MSENFFSGKRPHEGLIYDEYVKLMKEAAEEVEQPGADRERAELFRYAKLNLQRTKRIGKVYTASDAIRNAMESISGPQLWMVLTEPWCGDSAQCLPYIAAIARCNRRIDLRILLRDRNLDIMDQYLTNSKRSVPKLVAFDESGKELFRWGPRPEAAAELFRKRKEAGHAKETILEDLHRWYAKDRGQTIENEFMGLLLGN